MNFERIGQLHVRLDEEQAALGRYIHELRHASTTFKGVQSDLDDHEFDEDRLQRIERAAFPSPCDLRHTARAIRSTRDAIADIEVELATLKSP